MSLSKTAILLLIGGVLLWAQSPEGKIAGRVFDAQTGNPIASAVITLDGLPEGAKGITDADGNFTISVPPGAYRLQFAAPNYAPVQLTDVQVKAGEATEASTVMSNKAMVTRVDVAERVGVVEATASAMLAERRLAAVVTDSLSREELSSGTSSDAAGALEKVTGVSVVGEGFVYVRGLGERYSATQLNGAVIPTTEPEKRVVPLDLFPTGMIENIKIAKTYSPDVPAEFSGGLVQMQTVEFPIRKMFELSMKSGFNTATTFNRFFTYPGASGDFWGFGAGGRGIPSIIPRDRRIIQGQYTPQELQIFGRAFSDIWEPAPVDSARPVLDWSATGGAAVGKFGIVGAFSFSNKPQLRNEMQRYLRASGNEAIIATRYDDFREYSEAARMGTVFNVAYRISPLHKLAIRNTWTHDTDKTAREFSGYDGITDSDIVAQRLRLIERNVLASGIDGEHVMPSWKNSLLQWKFTYSQSGRNEPDLREVIRNLFSDGTSVFTTGSGSGIRFFSDMQDHIYDSSLNYGIPFFAGGLAGNFRTGFQSTVRRRDFQARRFRYFPQQTSTLNLYAPSNQLFAPANIRPSGFQIIEYTRGTDAYDASMDIYAGYSMVDLSLGPRWRLAGGVRFEAADQRVVTVDNEIPGALPVVANLSNVDPVPSVNLIYAMTGRQNLRVSFSRTLSRPDFRELSPFDFTNVQGGFVTVGNANLKRATINNYDVRWEFFPGGNQLVAASLFIKTFRDPIEQTVIVSNDLRQSFINAKGARNYGFELEFRRGLGSLTNWLRDFAVTSNFTFVDSNIEIRPEDALVLTSRSRPLVGQSRSVFNGSLLWNRAAWHSTAQFFTNYVSRRISDVGGYGLPDIYQEGTAGLDFMYRYSFGERGRFGIRFEAENLTDNNFRWTQGGILQRQFRLGRTFQVGVQYSFF